MNLQMALLHLWTGRQSTNINVLNAFRACRGVVVLSLVKAIRGGGDGANNLAGLVLDLA